LNGITLFAGDLVDSIDGTPVHDVPGASAALETMSIEPAGAGQSENPLFTSEGIRGRYLNDLNRATAARIAGALASCLWDDFGFPENSMAGPLRAPSAVTGAPAPEYDSTSNPNALLPTEGFRLLAPGRPGPSVVLGHDDRPSSPDIVTGVGQSLRRMGCQVVDIGLATRPCLVFAVDHLRAAGGVHLTGAGCDPGWTGLDFLSRGSVPCSSPGMLEQIAARYRGGYSRPSRRPGSQRTFQAAVPYEANLWKHFHALRPLKIALACPNRTVRDLMTRFYIPTRTLL
jgi:phosphomannomutase